MILQISSKLLAFIFCSVLILGIPRNLNGAVVAQAQDTVSLKNNLADLSTQEEIDLKQGKVILQGQKGKYLGQVIAPGNIDIAWEVLTDYNNFENFLPSVAQSTIISENGDRIIFEQVNVVDLWLFQQEFTIQIEAIKTPATLVDFKIVDGDLKKLVGKWQIEEISPGNILLRHGVEVEPGSDTEKPFFYGIYESSLEETLKAISQEISRRSQLPKF